LEELRCFILLGIGSCPDVTGSNMQNSMQPKCLESSSLPPEVHRNLAHNYNAERSLLKQCSQIHDKNYFSCSLGQS
jgi:hypothetical protein